MKALVCSSLVLLVSVCTAVEAGAQAPVGALAIDARQGDQWGWAVDYETATAARSAALSECGSGCSVVLTFGRCAAYAADQDADSTAVGWAESFDSAAGARPAALAECRSRGGGSGCIVRVWGCNGPVVEEGLNLDRAARRRIQQGLEAAGFKSWGRGRSVRSADAGCDSELAVVARRAGDGVSGRRGGKSRYGRPAHLVRQWRRSRGRRRLRSPRRNHRRQRALQPRRLRAARSWRVCSGSQS